MPNNEKKIRELWPTAEDFYRDRDHRTQLEVSQLHRYVYHPVEIHVDRGLAGDVTVQRMALVAANLTARWARNIRVVLPTAIDLVSPLHRFGDASLGKRILREMREADPFGDFEVSEMGVDRPETLRLFIGPCVTCDKRESDYHNRTIYGSQRYAQAYLTRRLHERDLSRGLEVLRITVDEFLDHWLKTAVKTKVRGKTYSDYSAMLRRYIRPALGAKMLASLSPLEIQAAYQIMVERKLSARTVRYAHSVLWAAIRQATRWQLLLADPTQGVQLPNAQRREMSVLTTEQARSFLRVALHSPKRCIFVVALTTGMRPSEYLALCWRDIDWDRGTVSVVRSLHKYEGQWTFADTKRVRSRRILKLQAWVLELLRNLKSVADGAGETCDSAFADLIFTTSRGEPINEEYLVKKHFKPLLREAGLPNIRLYDLRHTSATLALAVGVPPKVVSEQLGHASAAFTLDTYSHVLPHMQDEAAAKMEAALMNGLSL